MSLVVLVIARPFVGLLDIVGRDDAKEQRHAGAQTGFADAARRRGGDVIEMRSVAANNHSETNDCVEPAGLSGLLRA